MREFLSIHGACVCGSLTQTGTRPDATKGVIDEIYPEAVAKKNQFTVNIHQNVQVMLRALDR